MKLGDVQRTVTKKPVTFTIDKKINERFIDLAKKLKINKSQLVELSISNFLEEYEEEIWLRKHNLIYKITNELNQKIYIGVHSTDDINDNYMGSGISISKAIKKYGIENFTKEILFDFDTQEIAYNKERELVNKEFVLREDTYNINIGGLGGTGYYTPNKFVAKDENGNHYIIDTKDSRYLSGELVSINKGKFLVKDEKDNIFMIDNKDPRYLSGELISINKGKTPVKDGKGNIFMIDNKDPRYLSGELVGLNKNMITIRDKNNKCFNVSKDDPRYLSGELKSVLEKSKNKVTVMNKSGETFRVDVEDPRYLSGELVPPSMGRKWMYNDKLKKSKTILPKDINDFLSLGWNLGKIKY